LGEKVLHFSYNKKRKEDESFFSGLSLWEKSQVRESDASAETGKKNPFFNLTFPLSLSLSLSCLFRISLEGKKGEGPDLPSSTARSTTVTLPPMGSFEEDGDVVDVSLGLA